MEATFERTIDALDGIFAFVERFAAERELDESALYAANLAVEELFTNLVRHNAGGARRIEVALELESGRLTIRLKDFDVDPVDLSAGEPPDVSLPLEKRQPGGLGMHLVRTLFDSLSYDYRDRTFSVTAVKNLEDTHV
jgi:serine/threonine-protein kinase RsbW